MFLFTIIECFFCQRSIIMLGNDCVNTLMLYSTYQNDFIAVS
jgi:hypothetical protein